MGSYPMPSYGRWLARADFAPMFHAHRRFLQLLQWRCPGERWVLKSPSYLAKLPQFFAEYPDAYVVLTHRDPLKVLPSLVSIMATLQWMHSDTVDVDAVVKSAVRRHRDRDGSRHAMARRRHDSRRPDHRRAFRRSRRRPVADHRFGVRTHRRDAHRATAEDRMRAYLDARARASGTGVTTTSSPTPDSTSPTLAPASPRTRRATASSRSCSDRGDPHYAKGRPFLAGFRGGLPVVSMRGAGRREPSISTIRRNTEAAVIPWGCSRRVVRVDPSTQIARVVRLRRRRKRGGLTSRG